MECIDTKMNEHTILALDLILSGYFEGFSEGIAVEIPGCACATSNEHKNKNNNNSFFILIYF